MREFLSIQAQDFIEERGRFVPRDHVVRQFLSIQAQDFIEETCFPHDATGRRPYS